MSDKVTRSHHHTHSRARLLTFSLFTSTTAESPTALTILLARVLNAPHCLHASIDTTAPLALLGVAAADSFFLAGAAFFFAGAAFFLAGDALALPAERVVRAIVNYSSIVKALLQGVLMIVTARGRDKAMMSESDLKQSSRLFEGARVCREARDAPRR